MLTIWKFEMPTFKPISMPVGAKILTVQVQKGMICCWAIVDTEVVSKELREIYVQGTGHSMPRDIKLRYLSTIQADGGELVLHFFEREEPHGH